MRTRGPGVPRGPRGPRRAAPPPVRASGRRPSCGRRQAAGGRRQAAGGSFRRGPAAFPKPQAKSPPRVLRSPPRRRGLSFQEAARSGARVWLRLSPQPGPTRQPPPLSPHSPPKPNSRKVEKLRFPGRPATGTPAAPAGSGRCFWGCGPRKKASHETARVRRSCLRGHANTEHRNPAGTQRQTLFWDDWIIGDSHFILLIRFKRFQY
ncbi:unnamed protein product [Nyctereutes procyonoides]|uniref:(raccoon dog) hypothetical protein n=1 Tax=Nyctereutes procyonoides TaxID=34880 RepID=A0A811XYT3_NYCPR|nr:unnamed protein product [Nyctereutes procyonoides]